MDHMTGKNRRGAGRAARHLQRQTKGAIAHPVPLVKSAALIGLWMIRGSLISLIWPIVY